MAEPRSGAAGARRKFTVLPLATWAMALAGGWLAAGEARAVAYDVVLAIDRSASMLTEVEDFIRPAFATLHANILANGDDPRYALILVDAANCELAQNLTDAATFAAEAFATFPVTGSGTDFALAMRDCLPLITFRPDRPRYVIFLTDVATDDGSTLGQRDAAVAAMVQARAAFPLTGLFTAASPPLGNMPNLKDLVRRSSCFGRIGNPPWFGLTNAADVSQLVPGELAPTPWACRELFADSFEECGLARWSGGSEAPHAEQFTDLTPSLLADAFGACAPSLVAAEFVLADGSPAGAGPILDQMSDEQSAIFQSSGTGGLAATAGGAMIALSSGRARDLDAPGFIAPVPGRNFGRSTPGPAIYTAAHGGQIPGSLGCPSVTDSAKDSVGLRLTFVVPPGATRLAFDWRFLISDFPEWSCTNFADSFLAIVTTGTSPGLPLDRSVALDRQGGPVSSGSPDFVICNGCTSGNGELAGTGYDPTDSAATHWQTAFVPVIPGETLVLDLIALDIGDGAWDNIVFLDGMHWLYE